MDYVVGSVAALISGNVTPNRPKLVRRALTPMKHQPSPNVTPKSEIVDDRSIFLSPTLQKKKAIVKKSPKRIFENPELDVMSENENGSNPSSPVADKVKKQLSAKLGAQESEEKSPNTPKKKRNKSGDISSSSIAPESGSPQSANENTPKKQKKRKSSAEETQGGEDELTTNSEKSTKGKKLLDLEKSDAPDKDEEIGSSLTPKKRKKNSKNVLKSEEEQADSENKPQPQSEGETKSPKKNKKKNKKKSKANDTQNKTDTDNNEDKIEDQTDSSVKSKKLKKKTKDSNYVNPNAVTDKDSDSEHESDNEIVSENEEANKDMLDTGPVDESSDEEEVEKQVPKKSENKENNAEPRSADEVKRTLFVGNVPFSKKCKKEIKKIFSKYGDIETVRIRTVPVKDARVTPKLAVIRNELHPERTTVNVYVKFKDASSIDQALSENNTVLNNCHLRVSRSESTGAEHDPRCSVFVGNVPFALEDETLREKFEKCGEIASVRIIRDKKTNAGKGFAYVNFASKDGVELALAMSEEDLTIKNRIMRVKRCTLATNKQKNQGSGKGKFQGQNQGRNLQGKNQGRNVEGKNQFGKKGQGFKQRQRQTEEGMGDGALRRLMNKRKNQDGSDGPPNKRERNINQPHKEKKVRKEFVGMTAEKKKKNTFSKGQKKKKALSEILTKYS